MSRRDRKIIKLYRQGISVAEIARRNKLTRQRIYSIIHEQAAVEKWFIEQIKVNEDIEAGRPVDIRHLDLPVRTINALIGGGVETSEDLWNLTQRDLVRLRDFGRESLLAVIALAKSYGYEIK